MRENLFHGKRNDNGEWVEGYYCAFNGVSHRIYTGYAETDCGEFYPDYYEVIPETVGQYTGLTDKNGKKIFEGDIVTVPLSWDGDYVMDIGRVFYSEQSCGFYRTSRVYSGAFGSGSPAMNCTDEYEVISNIYDNPELIKDGV